MKRSGFAPRTTPMSRGTCDMKRTSFSATVKTRRKCCICKDKPPANAMALVCGVECALTLAQQNRDKAERAASKLDRADTKKRLEAIKPRTKWLAEAQAAFNAWIRARDADQPCISCGRYHQGSHDAGHYRSVGSNPALRFHEDNCHRQCVPCNQHLSGNIVEYRIGLLIKIGADRLAFLEGPHAPKKYSIDEIQAIKADYKARLKDMQRLAA